MSFIVVPADLKRDRHTITDLHHRFLTALSDDVRFQWLYVDNPAGRAKAWIVKESTTNAVIGTAAAFPRILRRGNTKVSGWVLGDFCIHDQYRTLGPALALQKSCLEGVSLTGNELWYDFPSTNMLAVYKRLRMVPSLSMVRFLKPLRIDSLVQKFLKNAVFAKGVSYLGNHFLAWKNRGLEVGHEDLTFSLHVGQCEEEFTALAETVEQQLGICVHRSASYLNWRYLRNPLCRYNIVTARKNGSILAFLVFTETSQDASIVDLFGIQDPKIFQNLIQWVVKEMNRKKLLTVSASLCSDHPWIPLFQSLGFHARERTPVLVAGPGKQPLAGSYENSRNGWYLMHGDRDV